MSVEDVTEWLEAVRKDINLSLEHRDKMQDQHVKFSSAIITELEAMDLGHLVNSPDFSK